MSPCYFLLWVLWVLSFGGLNTGLCTYSSHYRFSYLFTLSIYHCTYSVIKASISKTIQEYRGRVGEVVCRVSMVIKGTRSTVMVMEFLGPPSSQQSSPLVVRIPDKLHVSFRGILDNPANLDRDLG